MNDAVRLLENELPKVSGRYNFDAPLGIKGWFRCGGNAEVIFKPKGLDDLKKFLSECPKHIPVHVFGAMSNAIIRDGGVRGVTIRLGREFAGIETQGNIIHAGALALDSNVASVAADAGVEGLEFLSGIPGSIGGALRMNAGCYGTEIKDILVQCTAVDRNGDIHVLQPTDMDMTYRHTGVPDDYVFVAAEFVGELGVIEKIRSRINEIKISREKSQPIREKTGGSTFANPSISELNKSGLSPDTKVWELVDQVGGRGLMVGGAQMSEKHCNFMINTGSATATDLENLGEEIRSRVLDQFGITLRWEIKRVGERL